MNISPGNPVVAAGGIEKFRASEPVDWSLLPGSVGTIDPDGTYHAPASLAANNTVGGCQVLPNDDVFNTRVDGLPVQSNSAALIGTIPPSRVNYYPAWGINIADKSTPRQRMHFFYTPQYDGVFDMPQWPYLKLENGALAQVAETDRHMVVVDKDDCTFYEVYNPYERGKNPPCPDCTGQSGVHYSSGSYELLQGSTDAAGLPLMALSLHLDEITSGAIRHALRVTLANGLIQPTNVWPATSNARPYGKIPYGTRFRLRSSFDSSRLSPIAKVLVTQLKEYGLVLADGGGNWEVDGATDVTESPAVMAAFGEVAGSGITSRDFEVVDESSLMVARDSGRVRADSPAARVNSFAVVVARSKKNPSDVHGLALTLRPVTVGMPDPAIWIQSGVSKKLDFWVTGSSDRRLEWKLEPALGSISPEGTYTAPEVSSPITTTLIASSAADPAAKAYLLVTVVPKGPIRVDFGNSTNAPGTPHSHAPDYGPDSQGHMWWRELGQEYSYSVPSDNVYGIPWPKIPDIGLYYTIRYTLGDMLFRFFVPNGNYRIKLMYASPCPKGTFEAKYEAPIDLEAQRRMIAKDFDWGSSIGWACATPSTFDMPAAVKDESLEFALRRAGVGNQVAAPALSAFLVEPDSDPPHLGIDPEHVPDLSAGRTMQFRATGWFMDNSVTWSVAQGPGTINQNGLYTAPTAPTGKSQKVVVVAKSTTDPSKAARAEFSLVFGDLIMNPNPVNVYRGLEQKFDVRLSGVPYQNVAWSVSPSIGTIDASGVYRAPENLAHDEDVVVSAASRDVPEKNVSAKVHLKAVADPIRINCGDTGGFRDAKGNEWSGDFGFSPSAAYHGAVPIKNATPDMQMLYDSTRYRYINESFFYSFNLPNGTYDVTLLFADWGNEHAVKNFFDVKANGKPVLTHFNVDAVAGDSHTAVNREFTVEVTNHVLRLDFIGDGGNAYINGIQILPANGSH